MTRTLGLLALYLTLLLPANTLPAKEVGSQAPIGEELHFPGGAQSLSGNLLLPEGSGPFPAVVMLVGSGEYSYRSSWLPEQFPFWKMLSQQMIERGYATLLFDKRGINGSQGSWKKSSFEDRAVDALAAVHYLRERPEINRQRIGLLGHSQGGWIAHLAASQAPCLVAFAITLAGPTVSVREQVLDNYESGWRCEGLAEEEIAQRRQKQAKRFDRWGRFGYLGRIRNFDPATALLDIRQPLLAVFASNDGVVWPEKNRALLERACAASGNSALYIHLLDGAGHGLQPRDHCTKAEGRELASELDEALSDPAFYEAIDVYVASCQHSEIAAISGR